MSNHPAIVEVVERVRTDVIGGAADTAKEVTIALASLVRDTITINASDLALVVEEAVTDILRVMPSLAPPINALHKVMGTLEEAQAQKLPADQIKANLLAACDTFLQVIDEARDKVAQYGAEKIRDGDVVLTYSMSSTVWRIFFAAKAQGKRFRVLVTESRPANEGMWTVDEMLKAEIEVGVSVDACIGELIPQSNIVFVGADAVSSHGTVLCKVGSYPTALIAKAHEVPFYVAADTLKFDPTTLIGIPWKVDSIRRHEVLTKEYPEQVKVVGKVFDETPAELITAVITEAGLLHPAACVMLMWQMKMSQKLNDLLMKWSCGKL